MQFKKQQMKSKQKVFKSTLILGLAVLSYNALGNAPATGVRGSVTSLKSASKQLFRPELIKNWGLVNSQNKSHIQVVDAWKIEKGNHKVVVAVIDTGIDANHKDLQKNIWHGPSTNPNGPAHLKNNPFVAPKGQILPGQYGWNFVSDQPNPVDEHGHGTHVAGIIGAMTNLEAGVSGVAPNVSIMSVKYYSDANSGPVNLRNSVRAINFAIENGAQIINYSGGGPEFSEEEYIAIKKAEAKGVLFVAAAGNEHVDSDPTNKHYYPAAYGLSNIISVAATDINNNLLKSSNWGKKKVDVAAPGENIFSTLPGNRYGPMSGTSQATAFVSGIAALLLSKNPNLKPHQVKEIIRRSVDPIPTLADKLSTGGRVNAYKALLALGSGNVPTEKKELIRSVANGPVSLLKMIASPEAR